MKFFRRNEGPAPREEPTFRSPRPPEKRRANLPRPGADPSIPVFYVGTSPDWFQFWEGQLATYAGERYRLRPAMTEQALRAQLVPQFAQIFLVEATIQRRGTQATGATAVVALAPGFLPNLREFGPVVALLEEEEAISDEDVPFLEEAGFDLFAFCAEEDITWLIEELERAPLLLGANTPAEEEIASGWDAAWSGDALGRVPAVPSASQGPGTPRPPASQQGKAGPAPFWDASELLDPEFRSGSSSFPETRPGGPTTGRQMEEAPPFPRLPGPPMGSRPAGPLAPGLPPRLLPQAGAEQSLSASLVPSALPAWLGAEPSPPAAVPPMAAPNPPAPHHRAAPVQTRGLLGFWGPDPGDQRYLAALNLGLCLRERGVSTLVGEFCRPEGKLALHLGLEEEERSLLQTAQHIGEFLAASVYEKYVPFFERHLFHGLPPPAGSDPLIFFTSAAPDQEVELMSAQVTELLPPLLKRLGHWPYRLAIIGSALSDPLHLETLQNCDRLVLCLTPDPHGLELADLLVPRVLQAVGLTEANVDVLLLQYDRSLPGLVGQAQAGEPAHIQQLRKHYARALSARMEQVRGYLKRWGLANALLGCLPDALPLLEHLGKSCQSKHKTVLNFPEGQKSPYGQAIGQIAEHWVTSAAPSKTSRWGRR